MQTTHIIAGASNRCNNNLYKKYVLKIGLLD